MIEDNWYEKRQKRMAEKRKYLNDKYPNNLIQKLDIESLRKIGYAIGIGSTDTKKVLIDRIMQKQSELNPIIKKDKHINGEFYFNYNVRLMEYIVN